MSMLTLTIPNIGTDEKEFLRCRRMAQKQKTTIRIVDYNKQPLGAFNQRGDFSEAPAPKLRCTLLERFVATLGRQHTSQRGRQNELATMHVLIGYEKQLRTEAAA